MDTNPYLDALRRVDPGRTASFAELARLAERPKAARAAGRAIAALKMDDPRPWHRIVQSDGALAPDPARASAQVERLRKEGARPRADEETRAWARRRRAPWIGVWTTRMLLEASDERVPKFDPLRVEAIRDPDEGFERGFFLAPPPPSVVRELKRTGQWGRDEDLDPDKLLGLLDPPEPAKGVAVFQVRPKPAHAQGKRGASEPKSKSPRAGAPRAKKAPRVGAKSRSKERSGPRGGPRAAARTARTRKR